MAIETRSKAHVGTRERQRGFSLVELLVVVAVIGILAAIAVPALRYAAAYARATRIVTDFNFFRTALMEYHNDSGQVPPETGPGIEPPELQEYLEGKLAWTEVGFAWDWENWRAADGSATQPETGVVHGLTLRTQDTGLVSLVRSAWGGGEAREIAGYGYVFVIEGIGEGAPSGGADSGGDGGSGSGNDDSNGGGAVDPGSALLLLLLAAAAGRPRRT
jgi:prepilin-type N-terminal cleavage/methylation domain-containing protein